jgi:hypothetical protein
MDRIEELHQAGITSLPGGVTVDAFDTPFDPASFKAEEFGCDPELLKQVVSGLNVAQQQIAARASQEPKLSPAQQIERVDTLADDRSTHRSTDRDREKGREK